MRTGTNRSSRAKSWPWIAAVMVLLAVASLTLAIGAADDAQQRGVPAQAQPLIDKINASIHVDGRKATFLDRRRHDMLPWAIEHDERLRDLIATAIRDKPPGPKLLEAAADIAAMAAWSGLKQKAAKGDIWSRLFQAYVHFYVAYGRHWMTKFEGQALPEEALPAYYLARMALLGDLAAGDRAAAERMLRKLALEQQPRAMAAYGQTLQYGTLGHKDPGAAKDWYTRAAKAGDALGRSLLGYQLISQKIDVERGERLLRQAADQGLARAMYLLGFVHETGSLGHKDAREAARWRHKAVQHGGMSASIAELIKTAARFQGNAAARSKYFATMGPAGPGSAGYGDLFHYQIAQAYDFGYLLPQSDVWAFVHYRRAADLGSREALYRLFFLYYKGTGIRKDKAKAWASLEASARHGYADAYGRLLYSAQTLKMPQAAAAINRLRKAHVALDEAYARQYATQLAKDAARRNAQTKPTAAEQREAGKEARANEAEIAQRQAEQARLGIGKWPPPDIPFESAQDWHRQYTEAPLLTDRTFLEKVDRVSLELYVTPLVRDLAKPADLWLAVVKAIRAEGINVLPSSPVKLQVTLHLLVEEHSYDDDKRDNFRYDKSDNNLFLVEANFIVPARLYRKGNFYHRDVIAATAWNAITTHGRFSRADLLTGIAKRFPAAMDAIRRPDHVRNNSAEWLKTLWKTRDAPAMWRKYQAARREKNTDLRRWFTDARTYRDVDVDLRGAAADHLSSTRLERRWTRPLRYSGFTPSRQSPIHIHQVVDSWWHGPATLKGQLFARSVDQFYWTVDRINVSQDNVILNVDGKLYRTPRAILQSDFDLEIEIERYLGETLREDAREHVAEAAKAMGSGR